MNSRPKLYFITGISGSGKTTVVRRLCQLGHVAFDSKIQKGLFSFTDKDGNRPTGYQPHDPLWSTRYTWTLNKPLFDDLMEQNKTADRVFLCGGADDLMQYWPLGKKIFLLNIDEKTMTKRLNNPTRDNLYGKDKETQKILLRRRERYQNKRIALGAIPIDAARPIDDVVIDILNQTK